MNNLKKKIVILLIVGLLFNNLYLRYQHQVQTRENQESVEGKGYQLYTLLRKIQIDSNKFIKDYFYYSELNDEELALVKEKIRANYNAFDLQIYNIRSVTYLYQLMVNIIDSHEIYEMISREELTFLLRELHRDMIELTKLYIGSGQIHKEQTYNRVYGLDPKFNKKEKEFMDGITKKYFSFTTEDIEAAHVNKRSR